MVAVLAESGLRFAGKCDEGGGTAFEVGKESEEFGSFAGVGKGEDGVSFCKKSEVTMECVLGVKDDCRRAGGGEGGGNFVCDVSGFSDANEDDFLIVLEGVEKIGDGCFEGGV